VKAQWSGGNSAKNDKPKDNMSAKGFEMDKVTLIKMLMGE
jgi:hypothetical protein